VFDSKNTFNDQRHIILGRSKAPLKTTQQRVNIMSFSWSQRTSIDNTTLHHGSAI